MNSIEQMIHSPRELISFGRDNSILYAEVNVRSLDTPVIHLMNGFSSH
jgi:hypothetical protein